MKAAAEKLIRAADWDGVADLTHPAVIKLAGGREAMIQLIKSTGAATAIDSCAAGEPSDAVAGGSDLYVVVPTTVVARFDGERVTMRDFMVGVSPDGGKSWTFVNAGADKEYKALRQVLPDLPSGLRLPARQEPVVEKR